MWPDEFRSVVSTINYAGKASEKAFKMKLENTENINGFTPTNTPGVQSEQTTGQVKLYRVPVVAQVQLTLEGGVEVYAVNDDEAFEKVQYKIDNEALDDDLDMEDVDSGNTMSYSNVKSCCGVNIEIDDSNIEVVEENVDPADVLEEDVEQLRAQISWNTDALARQKAFLQSLVNEDDNDQAVAA